MRAHFQARYGAGPLHLAGHLAGFAIAAFAFDQIFSGGHVVELVEWFVGFALLHDLVLLPLYTAIDRIGHRLAARGRAHPAHRHAVPIINHFRAPALISGVLLLIYLPLISRVGDGTYFFYSGHHVQGYFRNWLLISLALFLISGFVYLVRVGRRRGRP
jgi:hypothetical protein